MAYRKSTRSGGRRRTTRSVSRRSYSGRRSTSRVSRSYGRSTRRTRGAATRTIRIVVDRAPLDSTAGLPELTGVKPAPAPKTPRF